VPPLSGIEVLFVIHKSYELLLEIRSLLALYLKCGEETFGPNFGALYPFLNVPIAFFLVDLRLDNIVFC
jgi:hypothetical protein